MSCLCQYYNTTTDQSQQLVAYPLAGQEDPIENNAELKVNQNPDAGQMADTYAENWLLKKKLLEYEVAIENLEQLVTTVVDKQHDILGEMFRLRAENRELKTECNQQREYHSMERNALIKELHYIQTLYNEKSQLALKEKSFEESESDYENDNDDVYPDHYNRESDSYDSDISDNSSTSSNVSSSATPTESEYEETDDDDENDNDDDEDDDDESQSNDTESESD